MNFEKYLTIIIQYILTHCHDKIILIYTLLLFFHFKIFENTTNIDLSTPLSIFIIQFGIINTICIKNHKNLNFTTPNIQLYQFFKNELNFDV